MSHIASVVRPGVQFDSTHKARSQLWPSRSGGQHCGDKGLLLRSDVHRLHDKGYVTVTLGRRFRVSGRLKTEFDDGESYYPLDGKEIWLPASAQQRPSREFLEWHADTVFGA